jgi:cell division control protein 12
MINQGSSGLGKTTFINTLFATLLKEHYVAAPRQSTKIERTVSIDVVRAGTKILIEIEEKGFNVKLTIIDTPGFGDYLNNQDCWVPVVEFLDDRYEQQIKTETQQKRNGADDMRVHACLYFIQPNGHTLTSLDIKAMKELGERVNLIPVIAKGDTMTKAAVKLFKDRVFNNLQDS